MSLPPFRGPHGVGSVTCRLTDDQRPSHLASESAGRSLITRLWYPTDATDGSAGELLWNDLRTDRRTPLPVRWLLSCIRTRRAARALAQIDLRAWTSSVVIYNHGLISFASENTTLMEQLAGQGHVVIAVQHLEQLAEFQALSRAQAQSVKLESKRMERGLVQATPAERARLAVKYYESATNTNRIVVERAVDTVFVLDRLREVLAHVPGFISGQAAVSSVHLVGFSVGGAVSTETAKRDSRARSVVNLDGGWHGSLSHEQIRVPYLMLYSAQNDGINDSFLPEQARRETPPGTRHLNYHDLSGLIPSLRHLGATGTTDAGAFLTYRNQIVQDFISEADRSLRIHRR
jgi:dienelactone hydrolase